jgi:hypothetical protein
MSLRGHFKRLGLAAMLWPALTGQTLVTAEAGLDAEGVASYALRFLFQPTPAPPRLAGASYSAEEISDTAGTRKLYRDAQGRTRVERTLPFGVGTGPAIVEITDPLDGFIYTLNPQTRTAHRVKLSASGDQEPAVAVRAASAAAPAAEALGEREMEGIRAVGTRTARAVPGPDGATALLLTEVWVSPELRLTLMVKHTDATGREQTVRLTNLTRAEPDAGRFRVPGDYTVRDEAGAFNLDFRVK